MCVDFDSWFGLFLDDSKNIFRVQLSTTISKNNRSKYDEPVLETKIFTIITCAAIRQKIITNND